ncbi:NAD(+)--dinitrogen-reductase ADP-D-ribosyltransferase [Aromatoleum diolicum]|uniref:NAD(+)-dinitrogen-reductase ADP-D-ribosyltransferase n=1 Tax=Aromatoleum diolicum TaxID=75796 RepID=A0ABX1Q821_9RHOO|nr:NAD(+)--dinitrogen-reductase ADP-D-ribosyltransferase [Aromatoleum diolicum]NMG73319.1 NAD(+)-dinitrogen-reductase ADP-D-ribosyltransferase [Aromatoleum diolicum]
MSARLDAAYGHSTNLVGIPTGLLASAVFNENPLALTIHGVSETNRALFAMLQDATNGDEAVLAFQIYMRSVFELDAPSERDALGRKRFRASYLRLLRGWGFNANGKEAAVLKGWVESRFGLQPTFHRMVLGRYPSAAWMTYVEEKMSARFHNNCIHLQLDLLYEYAQHVFRRWLFPGLRHLRLYRGVNDFAEHQVVAWLPRADGKLHCRPREAIARLNNLVSFTTQREIADQFGDTILEVEVPICKIVYCNALMPGPVLRGEGELLVLGGEYRVKMATL